jgi:HTH-type transcriptional regulator, competence development regulator
MLGKKLREMREANGYLQRQVAAELEVDTAYVSKIEHDEKPVSRGHLKKLSKLFNVSENKLLSLWLADRVLDVVKNDDAVEALRIAMNQVKSKK